MPIETSTRVNDSMTDKFLKYTHPRVCVIFT